MANPNDENPGKSGGRARNWCFTLNNPTSNDEDELKALKGVKYMCVGHEVGDSGTPHLQGYVQFKDAKTISSLKKVNKAIHWEIARGSADQASEYCKKDGKFWEIGEMGSGQGFRTDLEVARQQILNNTPQIEIANENFFLWVQYGRRLEEYRSLVQPRRSWKSDVIIFWGESGTGKSRKANELYPNADRITYQHPFFLGYTNNDVVIFDDFDPATMPVQVWLEICDRYPKKINVKGSEKEWNPKTIVFTSNHDPKFWYGNDEVRIQRRITINEEFTQHKSG